MANFDGLCFMYRQNLRLIQTALFDHFTKQGDAYSSELLASAYKEIEKIGPVTGMLSHKHEDAKVKPDPQAEISKATFEFCLREFVWNYRAKANAISMGFACFFLLFDFLFFVADAGSCDVSFPLLMMEEFASTASMIDIRYIVAYMSDRILVITNQLVPAKGKGLAFLRLCNDLQRRCSKFNDAHLVGELKILLAIAFPLNDRSGTNPRGDFDISYLIKPDMTHLDKYAPETQESFLCFWKLQDYLASPSLLFEESKFNEFQKGVNWSLKIITNNIRDARMKVRAHKKTLGKLSDKVIPSLEEAPCSPVAPPHLAAISLLPSQLCDPDFQKTIMVQYLILFQYLLSLTSEDPSKFPAAAKPPAGFVWSEQQTHWMIEHRRSIYKMMQEISFGSEKFPSLVNVTLKAESMYAKGKDNGANATSPKQQDIEALELKKIADHAKVNLTQVIPSLEHLSGATKFGHLWNLGEHNTVFPKNASLKRGRPSLDEFLSQKVRKVEELDEKDQHRQTLSWKALRLASKTQVQLITKTASIDILALRNAMETFMRPSIISSLKPDSN